MAPIVVFAYRRPEHLRASLRTLQRCRGFAESKIIVFGDGPKSQLDREAVDATRRVATEELGARAEYRFRDTNAGLAASVIAGVSEVIEQYGRAIVLEDDLELSECFLEYMNDALEKYESEQAVYQISGQIFDTPAFEARMSALFLPFTTSWGWATWRRAWQRFDPSAKGWRQLSSDRELRRRFNLDGSYDFSTMLERQMAGVGDSWAIRWYWSVFLHAGLVCFPPSSLVRNIGMDGSGTHGRGLLRGFRKQVELRRIESITLPDRAVVDARELRLVKQSLWRQNGGWIGAAADMIRRRAFALTGGHI